MKMTRRNFLSTSAVAALACGASLTAHAAGSTDENSLNFITHSFHWGTSWAWRLAPLRWLVC